jgi:proton-dependent oligopeptide transporter, POT family
MSAIPVTFLEVHYDFWVAYLLAASALGLCLLLFAIWASKLGRCMASPPLHHVWLTWYTQQAKVVPQGTVLPQAARALTCAARNGFKLENAKSSYQETHHGRTVPWSDQLVEELGRGLIACRVMYVGH